MDADRFDAFVRSLPVIARRTALGSLLGAGLAALHTRFESEDTAARKKRRKKKRKKKCKGGKKKCGKKCVNLATDGNNCGVCGNACKSGACVHGACTCQGAIECPDGCLCASRAEGGPDACQSGVDQTDTCNEDADCPFRSFCRNVGNECALPCLV
ncbi:MAG: hypothetical protein ACRDJC_19740 [Thermomicrobiales bacterium]